MNFEKKIFRNRPCLRSQFRAPGRCSSRPQWGCSQQSTPRTTPAFRSCKRDGEFQSSPFQNGVCRVFLQMFRGISTKISSLQFLALSWSVYHGDGDVFVHSESGKRSVFTQSAPLKSIIERDLDARTFAPSSTCSVIKIWCHEIDSAATNLTDRLLFPPKNS